MSVNKVFISYSDTDKEWMEKVRKQLSVLAQQGDLDVWSNDDIRAGEDWRAKIEAALNQASLAVLLISVDFLTSDFILGQEVPTILKRRQEQGLQIYPIIVRSCSWGEVDWLSSLKVRPLRSGKEALALGSPAEQDNDLGYISVEIASLFKQADRKVAKTSYENVLLLPPRPVDPSPPAGRRTQEYADLEITFHHRDADEYLLELRFSQSGKDEYNILLQQRCRLELDTLDALAQDPRAYGIELQRAIFSNPQWTEAFTNAQARARELGVGLRFRIYIGPSAMELNCVLWETLSVPSGNEHLLRSSNCVFARCLLGAPASWEGVHLRPKSQRLRAVIANLYPSRTDGYALPGRAALPRYCADEQLTLAKQVLEPVDPEPQTCDRIADLEPKFLTGDGVDILYLNCHAVSDGRKPLLVVDGGGTPEQLDSQQFIQRLCKLRFLPRLLVLAPALDRDEDCSPVALQTGILTHFAGAAVEAGVASVLTAQGTVSKDTWARFLLTFFTQLSQHGEIDLAIHEARSAIEGPDWWLPVLISRLRMPRIWYSPGFIDEQEGERAWKKLLTSIEDRRCTPVIGPDLAKSVIGSRRKIAKILADKHYFPLSLQDRTSLRQVFQYLDVEYKGDRDFLLDQFEEILKKHFIDRYSYELQGTGDSRDLDQLLSDFGVRNMKANPDEPYRVLAELPFPIYVSTNLNGVLSEAIRRYPENDGREPREEWFSRTPKQSGPKQRATPTPTVKKPLVYYLFGRLSEPESVVLTEDDYFDFLIKASLEKHDISSHVSAALTGDSLLFLGFRMHQWDFRVLWRSIMALQGSNSSLPQRTSVAVQIDPDDDVTLDPKRAKKYLEKHFSQKKIDVFWGTTEEFLKELRERWQAWTNQQEQNHERLDSAS